MAYSLTKGIKLGSAHAGLTLEVQLVDTAGNNSGAAITTTFVEYGTNGEYQWFTNAVPDGFRGGGKVQNNADHSFLTYFSINPEELENTDQKITTTEVNVRGGDSRDLTEVYDKVLLVTDAGSGMAMRMLFSDSATSYAYYYANDADAESDANRVHKRKLYAWDGSNPVSIAQLHGVGKLEAA